LEWWTAVLRNANRDEIDGKFWIYCKDFIDLPDIQLSTDTFEIRNNRIRAPLSMLYGIGEKAQQQLFAGVPYASIEDFCQKIKDYKESNRTELQKTVTDETTGETKTVEKTRLGHSALNDKVIHSLIVCGVMDSLFPSNVRLSNGTEVDLDIEDKIAMYEKASRKVNGKKAKKVDSESGNDSDFISLKYTAIKKFLLKKKILPSYAEPLLPLVVGSCKKIYKENDLYKIDIKVKKWKKTKYKWESEEREESRIIVDSSKFAALLRSTVSPPGGWCVAVAVYIINDRRFTYNNKKTGQKCSASELTVDVDGERINLVQWPEDGALPHSFDSDLSDSACIMCLNIKPDLDIKLESVIVVERATEKKEKKEK
jgi:hypothetical protein